MDPVAKYLPAIQPFRDIHGEITACFANKDAAAFHELWWCQCSSPLSVCVIRAKLAQSLDLEAVPNIDEFPTSIEDFLDTVSPVFNASLLQGMAERAQQLHHVSGLEVEGGQTLSDVFIRRQTHRTWALEMISAIATRYHEHPLQPIEQITMCGSTMLEAWLQVSLPDAEVGIRQAEDQVHQFACLQLAENRPKVRSVMRWDKSDWSPSDGPSSLPVFRGSHAGLAGSPEDELTNGTFRPSRAVPALGTMPLVSTAFHAFKTYLYTVFRAQVISNLFDPPLSGLQKRWTVNDACWTADEARKHFSGVILSRFQLTSEQEKRVTSYQVPVSLSSTGAWQRRIAELNKEATISPSWGTPRYPAHVWAKIFDAEEGAEWPNVLHYRDETGNQRVVGAETEEWLTYWCGEGVSALKRNWTGTFAISFVQTTAPFSVILRNR